MAISYQYQGVLLCVPIVDACSAPTLLRQNLSYVGEREYISSLAHSLNFMSFFLSHMVHIYFVFFTTLSA
jgi:hypothetical protein